MISLTPASLETCSAATHPRSRYWISSAPCGPPGSSRSPGTKPGRRWLSELLRDFLPPEGRGGAPSIPGRTGPPGRAATPPFRAPAGREAAAEGPLPGLVPGAVAAGRATPGAGLRTTAGFGGRCPVGLAGTWAGFRAFDLACLEAGGFFTVEQGCRAARERRTGQTSWTSSGAVRRATHPGLQRTPGSLPHGPKRCGPDQNRAALTILLRACDSSSTT